MEIYFCWSTNGPNSEMMPKQVSLHFISQEIALHYHLCAKLLEYPQTDFDKRNLSYKYNDFHTRSETKWSKTIQTLLSPFKFLSHKHYLYIKKLHFNNYFDSECVWVVIYYSKVRQRHLMPSKPQFLRPLKTCHQHVDTYVIPRSCVEKITEKSSQ